MAYANEQEGGNRRRDVVFAFVVVVLALSTTYLSQPMQQSIANGLQATLLRPFIGMQEVVTAARRRAGDVDRLTDELDSLTAIMSTQASLAEENHRLRALLGLAERGGPSFVPATVLRPGTAGSQSMLILDVGARDGVPARAPVVGPHGLVGYVTEVRATTSVALDWTHPDFRVSAMLVDGTTYGIVERRRGRQYEDDRLILNGTAYTDDVRPGTVIVTSGAGATYPRGIPIGKVDRLLDMEGSWRKSYWIEPMVEPASATHVLVLTTGAEGDVSGAWPVDSLVTGEEAIVRTRPR